MASAPTKAPPLKTVAELLARLGNIPAYRVRLVPTPGTATEKDVLEIDVHKERLCELVEGTLVEKVMGYEESELAMLLGSLLVHFVRSRKLGIVTGSDGTIRLLPGLVRIPDIAFLSRARFPGGKRPVGPIPQIAPDLVVEVLSKGNTKKEMRRKLGEYFEVGVRLVWFVHPRPRTVQVFTAADRSVTLQEHETLDGGEVLPGFRLSLRELFTEPDE
jgi:Uma2 family endonuclease